MRLIITILLCATACGGALDAPERTTTVAADEAAAPTPADASSADAPPDTFECLWCDDGGLLHDRCTTVDYPCTESLLSCGRACAHDDAHDDAAGACLAPGEECHTGGVPCCSGIDTCAGKGVCP